MCAINNAMGEITVTDADLLGTTEAREQNQNSRTGYGLKVLHQAVPGKEYRAEAMCPTRAGPVGWDSVIKVAAVVFQPGSGIGHYTAIATLEPPTQGQGNTRWRAVDSLTRTTEDLRDPEQLRQHILKLGTVPGTVVYVLRFTEHRGRHEHEPEFRTEQNLLSRADQAQAHVDRAQSRQSRSTTRPRPTQPPTTERTPSTRKRTRTKRWADDPMSRANLGGSKKKLADL